MSSPLLNALTDVYLVFQLSQSVDQLEENFQYVVDTVSSLKPKTLGMTVFSLMLSHCESFNIKFGYEFFFLFFFKTNSIHNCKKQSS